MSISEDRLREALRTIERTIFSGSEISEEYQRGNRDAHEVCRRIATSALREPSRDRGASAYILEPSASHGPGYKNPSDRY